MINHLIILTILCAVAIVCNGKISDQRLCGDAACANPVSYARTLLRYSGDDPSLIGFPPGVVIAVYSKSAGSNPDLWGVELNGKRGYAPKGFLREERVVVSKLDFLVPTEAEPSQVDIASSVPPARENVKPSESYEVVSGTTLFYDDLQSAPPVTSTALPLEATSSRPPSHRAEPAEVDVASGASDTDDTTLSPPIEDLEQEPQEEGSAQRLYHYITSLLPTEGSGFLSSEEQGDENTVVAENVQTPEAITQVSAEKDLNGESDTKKDDKVISVDQAGQLVDIENTDNKTDNENIPRNLNVLSSDVEKAAINAEANTNTSEEDGSEEEDDYEDEDDDDDDDSQTDKEIITDHYSLRSEQTPSLDHPNSEPSQNIDHPSSEPSQDVDHHSSEPPQTIDSPSSGSTQTVDPPSSESPQNIDHSVSEDTQNIDHSVSEDPQNTDHSVSEDPQNIDHSVSENPQNIDHSVYGAPQTTDTFTVPNPNVDYVSNSDSVLNSEPIPITDSPILDTHVLDNGFDYSSEELVTSSTAAPALKSSSDDIGTTDPTPDTPTQTAENFIEVDNNNTWNVSDYVGEQNVDGSSIYNYFDPITNNVINDQVNIDSKVPQENIYEQEETTSAPSLPWEGVAEVSTVLPPVEVVDETAEQTEVEDNSPGFFASILDMVPFFHSGGDKPNDPVEQVVTEDYEETIQDDVPITESEVTTDNPKSVWPTLNIWEYFQRGCSNDETAAPNLPVGSYYGVLTIAITAMAVLVFTLGYYKLENSRQDSTYVAKINKLEKALYVTTKQCEQLKDDLNTSCYDNEEVARLNVDVATLQEELALKMTHCEALEDQVVMLHEEINTATETGEELNRMLSVYMSDNNLTDMLRASIDSLQEQLASQQTTITATNKLLFSKNMENDLFRAEMSNMKETLDKTRKELAESSAVCNEMRAETKRQKEEWAKSHDAELTARQSEVTRLEGEVRRLEESLQTRESELTILQQSIEKIKSGESIQEMLDAAGLTAKLETATKQCQTLREQLTEESGARKLLEDHVKVVTREIISLQEGNAQAEKEKTEAINKLNILAAYFEEKEAMLQKDIDLHEAMFKQKSGDAESMYKHVKSLQEQANHNKSQIEMLKKEYEDQEQGYKEQLYAAENRAHDNWLAARQAERRCEELKQEAAILRNRLTVVETQHAKGMQNNDHLPVVNDRVPLEGNGEIHHKSPLHMHYMDLQHYTPPPYMPPPLYEPDQRLPPLGCLPTAPPPMPPSTYSPRARHYEPTFRPMPPPHGRTRRSGSNSSDHSSESRDKSGPRRQS